MYKKQKLEFAGFWPRLTAFALDSFIIVLPVFMVTVEMVSGMLFDHAAIKASANKEFEITFQLYHNFVFIFLTGFAGVAAVSAFFITSRWQATPGKRIVGLYVANPQGAKLKFADAFGRTVALPLLIMLVQIFERYAVYQKLEQLKASDKPIMLEDLQQQLITPVSQMTSLIVFIIISFWFMRIFFNPEKATGHDVLFNTRVFVGKK